METFGKEIAVTPFEVVDGYIQVPDGPGLGIELDPEALENYRVEKADHSLPRRLVRVNRPSGSKIYFANSGQKWTFYGNGNNPVDDWGCSTDLLDDDGSADFDDLHKRASLSPVITAE